MARCLRKAPREDTPEQLAPAGRDPAGRQSFVRGRDPMPVGGMAKQGGVEGCEHRRPPGLPAQPRLCGAASVVPLLDQVRCPTLIIHGRHDGLHRLSEAQKPAARNPGAEPVVLETAKHIPLPGNVVWDEFV